MFPDTAADWIRHLQLEKHIEGGWYNQVYRSPLTLAALPGSTQEERSLCTHIYFLLEVDDFSTFHRIRSDELWHFYHGTELTVYELDDSGHLTEHQLGHDISRGALPFCVIKKGNWFGARVTGEGGYALVGCTVSPGFEYSDLELAKADELSLLYPLHETLVRSLCRQ